MLQAGVGKTDITSPVGMEMTGYLGRQQPSLGVHDPLFAKGLVLDDGNTKLALVSCDLLALSRESTQTIRSLIQKKSGIPTQHILIACTHTHSGPATVFLRNCGTVNKDWLAKLEQQIAETVVRAAQKLQPAKLGYGIGIADINLDRREKIIPAHSAGVVDKSLGVIKIERPDGEPLAIILNYTCHAVVQAEKNRSFSADFPGVASQYIESNYPSEPVVLYFNGACGNINPVIRGGTWEDVAHLGEIVGKEAVYILNSIAGSETLQLSAISRKIELQLKIPTIAGIEHELDLFRERAVELAETEAVAQKGVTAMIWWAEETLDILKQGKQPESIPLEIQVLKLGDLNLVGIGAEVFCEIGLNIKKQAGSPTFVIGYANHDIGYIPTRKAFEEGGYEVTNAYRYYGNFIIMRDADHIVESTALNLINSLP
jgi:hypothetical protein